MALRPGKHYVNSNIRLTIVTATSGCTEVDTEILRIKFMSPCGVLTTLVYGTDDALQRSTEGNYFVDFTPNEAGRWAYRWETADTDDAEFNVAEEGNFLVQASAFYDPPNRRAYN